MNPTLRNWLIILVVGAAIWFSPIPTGLKPDAWHIFAVFVATVLGFILHPMPIGAIAFISLTFCCFTGLLKTSQVLMGFGNGTIWLIVCAFFLSRAFIKTGFGRRIAYVIIKLIGRSSLTLGYSIALSELVVSPAMPSATSGEKGGCPRPARQPRLEGAASSIRSFVRFPKLSDRSQVRVRAKSALT